MRKELLKKFETVELKPLNKNGNTIASYFGENVFDVRKMEKYLSKKTIMSFKNWINKGEKIDMKCADEIAGAMKN
nr:glutamine synthetase III [bacterium]